MAHRTLEECLAQSPLRLRAQDVVSVMGYIQRFADHTYQIAASDQMEIVKELDFVAGAVAEAFEERLTAEDRYWQGMDIRRKLNCEDRLD